ncbi:MAG TPA: flagellar regulator YcgR PilZN domain-containing protein [Pseudomonadales bacterium]|nr:flagellar regulator YcgR PilZN domain-containing protein [Pseudomonadales bacterium]
MRFFDWFKFADKSEHSLDAAKQQAYLALSRLMREHVLVRVKIEGVAQIYQSMVLGVNANDGSLLLDELFPRDGILEGLDGQWITVFCSQGGMTTRFVSCVMDTIEQDGDLVHRLSFPHAVEQDQRRAAFRLPVGDAVPIEAVVESPSKQSLHAKVIDVSPFGVRLAIEGLDEAEVKSGVVLERLNLVLGREGNIHCGLDVRNARRVGSEGGYTLVGGRFVGLPESQRSRLDRFILRAQRNLRRRELDAA